MGPAAAAVEPATAALGPAALGPAAVEPAAAALGPAALGPAATLEPCRYKYAFISTEPEVCVINSLVFTFRLLMP